MPMSSRSLGRAALVATAYVQALYPVTTTTPFTVTLVWKSNVGMAAGTHIAMGAGPLPAGSATFSPTSLTVDLRC